MRLIDADALKKAFKIEELYWGKGIIDEIDNAPTVTPIKQCKYCKHCGNEDYCSNCHSDHSLFEYYERPQGEYVDISKLRLMTVEECAGHTIDYAMGWKACIEWIKKGCKEE